MEKYSPIQDSPFLYEWDEHKSRLNAIKHGISFEEGATAFEGTDLRIIDEALRKPYDEARYSALVRSEAGTIFAIAIIFRQESVRIISARTADANERRRYELDERGFRSA